MKKKQNNKALYIGIAIIAIIFIYGGSHGWFKSNVLIAGDTINKLEQPPTIKDVCTLTITPSYMTAGDTFTGKIKAGARVFCEVFGKPTSGGDWGKVYEGVTDVNGNLQGSEELYIEGSFVFKAICGECITNEATLNVNPTATHSCTDTDGINKMVAGHVIYDGGYYYDQCVGGSVKEFYCNGDIVAERMLPCDLGYHTFETRSGCYCQEDVGYSVGDIVDEINFNENIGMGQPSASWYIDLSGIEMGGEHQLGAKIWTSWAYANDKCVGYQGSEGMEWNFQDSSGIKWLVVDTYPQSHYEELCPLSWNGQTPWKLYAGKILNLPECIINAGGRVEVFVCE